MSKAAKSVLVHGIYLAVMGLAFLIVPNTPLTLFGFPATNEPWIRVVAMLVLILAYYSVQAARSEMETFFRWTVHARPFVVVCFTVLVALRLTQPKLIVFGLIDLSGAVWTGLALRGQRT